MCGRFRLKTNKSRVAKIFQVDGGLDLVPRDNIAATQEVAVVRLTKEGDQRELPLLRWA